MNFALLFPCAALLLLSACTPKDAPSQPTPSSPIASTPAPTSLWWEQWRADDLPETDATVEDVLASTPDQLFRLGHVPDSELALYAPGGLAGDAEYAGVLLQSGKHLTHFEQVYLSAASPRLPDLWWDDFDGDGQKELAVNYLTENSENRHIFELHIYRPDGNAWVDCGFFAANWEEQLLEQVTYTFDPVSGQVTAALSGSDAFFYLEDQPDPVSDAPLTLQGMTFFRRDGSHLTAVFGLGVRLIGEDTPYYFGNLLADLAYNGTSFSLENLRLETNFNV